MKFWIFLLLGVASSSALGDTLSLKSPSSTLRLQRATKGIALQLDAGEVQFEEPTPLFVEVVDVNGAARWISGAYSHVAKRNGDFSCDGELRSENGTRFCFFDRFFRDGAGFGLQRRLEIVSPSPKDVGFASRFGLAFASPTTTRDTDVLMPGVWYRDNHFVPPQAFGADTTHQVLMCREDRSGLPLVMARDKRSGMTLELQRVGGNPTTFAGESGGERLVDERFQVGALGFQNAGHLEAAFSFPGTEDDRPLADPNSQPGARFLPRLHPVKVGVSHSYTLHFEARQTTDFPAAVETITKAAIERAHPPLVRADLKRVYRASMDLLDAVVKPYNGTVSVPFQVGVPGGEVKDTSMQMGFVGMALPCSALLLRDGLETGNQSAVERATQVLDLWAEQSPTSSGVPKNWCDFPSPDKVTWRPFPTHLRVACDGMTGILRAWNVARVHGLDKPKWLACARTWGDFLVSHQNADGSWFGSWNFDGTPHDRFTNASTHPLAFLVDLARATGDDKYKQAALRGGEFCWRTVHQPYSYVGGTPDNPNVTDKEAGFMAVQGFLALFDSTGERRWLDAAKQAAIFCETWVYWRDLPIPEDQTERVFPLKRTTVGMSLISTGHSGADNFMAAAPFLWYRIYLASGDAHFLETARLLLHNTKQILDWDGTLGFKFPGLLPEAMSLSNNRGRGVAGWLPWLTFVVAEPLVRLNETFGSSDIDEIEKMPVKKRRQLSAKFAKTRGYMN